MAELVSNRRSQNSGQMAARVPSAQDEPGKEECAAEVIEHKRSTAAGHAKTRKRANTKNQ